MEFKEFSGFSNWVGEFLTDLQLQALESELIGQPEKGDLIKGTGGARKIRVSAKGKGKRGGARVIYYFQVANAIHFLAIYPKNAQADLNPKEKKMIAELVQAIKEGVL
jgi:hypothetical protein